MECPKHDEKIEHYKTYETAIFPCYNHDEIK